MPQALATFETDQPAGPVIARRTGSLPAHRCRKSPQVYHRGRSAPHSHRQRLYFGDGNIHPICCCSGAQKQEQVTRCIGNSDEILNKCRIDLGGASPANTGCGVEKDQFYEPTLCTDRPEVMNGPPSVQSDWSLQSQKNAPDSRGLQPGAKLDGQPGESGGKYRMRNAEFGSGRQHSDRRVGHGPSRTALCVPWLHPLMPSMVAKVNVTDFTQEKIGLCRRNRFVRIIGAGMAAHADIPGFRAFGVEIVRSRQSPGSIEHLKPSTGTEIRAIRRLAGVIDDPQADTVASGRVQQTHAKSPRGTAARKARAHQARDAMRPGCSRCMPRRSPTRIVAQIVPTRSGLVKHRFVGIARRTLHRAVA